MTELPEAVRAACMGFDGLDEFATHFESVVDAELTHAYHRLGHGKATKAAKAYFHKAPADLASELIGLAYPPVDLSDQPAGPLGPFDPGLAATAAQALEEDGYFVWPARLDEAIVDSWIEALKHTAFVERGTRAPVDGYDPATAASHKANAVDVASNLSLLQAGVFQDIICDPTLLETVQRRLDACPVHTSLSSWWTVGATLDERDLSRAAQLYHQDKDWIRWVKAFIYLTDVEEDTGPHVYVAGSHRDYQDVFFKKFREAPKFSTRFNDEEIIELFGADRIRSLTGKKGSIILADTSGLHKGAPVQRDHRLLVQVEWANSLYMSPQLPLDERLLKPELAALRDRTPRLFVNYDHAARERQLAEQASSTKAGGPFGKLLRSVRKRLPI